MVNFNPDIFKTGDIRGIYGKDFDEAFAFQLGAKVATFFNRERIVIGRDGRASSDPLARSVIEGARSAGGKIIAIGQCSTPLFYFTVGDTKAAGGIMITASHNPGEYNGFKIVKEKAALMGGDEVRYIFNDIKNTHEKGSSEQRDYIDDYLEKVLALGGNRKGSLRVGFDAPEAIKHYIPVIGRRANIDFFEGDTDGLDVHFDPDGDRVNFFEKGRKIPSEFVFMLLTEVIGFKKVVFDFRFSKSVYEKLGELGVEGFPSKVGRFNVYGLMKDHEADFGAETSGHFYFKHFDYLEAPELMMLLVINLLKQEGKSLTELTAPYRKYFKCEEMSFPINAEAFEILEKQYSHGEKLSHFDGLTIDLWEKEGWWLNTRLSHTESLMRLIVEAKSTPLMLAKVKEISALIKKSA
jgi:phosphomannomutase